MLRIVNWSSHQSYKDRTPPWIRFHRAILDNFDFHCMSANARALLPMLWLLASEDKDPVSGLIRISYERIAFRLRLPVDAVASGVKECVASGFIIEESQECTESVTKPLQIRNQTVTPETETETETEEEIEVDESGAGSKTPFERVYDFGCTLFPQLATQATAAIHQWLNGGADIELDIIPEIKRLHGKGVQPRGWGLFTQDIANAVERRRKPLPKGEKRNARPASKHAAFAAQDYRAGTDGFIVS